MRKRVKGERVGDETSLDHIIDSTADKAIYCASPWKLFKHGLGSQLLGLGCPVTKPAMGHYVTCTQKWWDKFNSVLFAL